MELRSAPGHIWNLCCVPRTSANGEVCVCAFGKCWDVLLLWIEVSLKRGASQKEGFGCLSRANPRPEFCICCCLSRSNSGCGMLISPKLQKFIPITRKEVFSQPAPAYGELNLGDYGWQEISAAGRLLGTYNLYLLSRLILTHGDPIIWSQALPSC